MLYDPKWEKEAETKADPFALASLIAWLEQQPPETAYDYRLPDKCLVAQYLKAQGFTSWNDYCLASFELDRLGWSEIAQGKEAERKWTFGEALKRARSRENS
jgi:hypothetical protein